MRRRRRRPRAYRRRSPSRAAAGTRVVSDCSETFVPAVDWLGGLGADVRGNAERRAEDLVRLNHGLLSDLQVRARVGRVRGDPGLHVEAGSRVGAIPLRSPVTGRPDFGLVVTPRFPWSGVGDLLATTGFRIVPELLPLPELPQSERRIPPWVLSSVVLQRLERLLEASTRRFTTVEADLRAPRGAVDWTAYASARLPRGRALEVPCRYPDLRDDERLRSAIHWTVRRHRDGLLAAPAGGRVVRELLALCERLLGRLAGTPPVPPGARLRAAWHRTPFVPRAFREGIAAIDWTADERGLAGLSDLAGLSWRLDMAAFFEAWVEAITAWVATRTGAFLRAGREERTRVSLDWRPRRAGSQRSLLPDLVLSRPGLVVVLDAKYKRHAADIERLGWSGVADRLREEHRADLLQALAYSSLYDAERIVSLLVYPCGVERWRELARRRRVLARARVRSRQRNLEMGLLAVPLGGDPTEPGAMLEQLVREPLS
ncbi:MAG TPA: hypothetical protein RMH99_09570 [Sandaracinaceae bacterium LLY-WYZ-13_1]|nr:hypothetical protein [Sandaracinaceae bacterium LLY-WYZ-13_1]